MRYKLIQNIFALSGMQFATYLFPLLTVPYLTRVLGPAAWGVLAFALAFGQYIIMLVEYGFGLSATREVALHRDAPDKLADLLAGVLGAKVLLALFVVGFAFLVQRWVPPFREHSALFWCAVFWALAQGFTLIWYYQGLERMRLVAALDTLAKALATGGILILVASPEDGWKVPALQGLASFLSMAVALRLAHRKVPFRFPTPSLVWEALHRGWTMFISRSAPGLYATGNTFILGLFAPPQLVGYYAGAEKISMAILGLVAPVSQALYPRFSYLAHHARTEAAQLARVVLPAMGLGGMLASLLVFFLAPLLVRIGLGEELAPAAPVLQVLTMLFPLVALSNVLGIQWMLPLRMERTFIAITLGAGLLNLILAIILAPRYAHLGMAWAVVMSELFVTIVLFVVLRLKKVDPLSYGKRSDE